MQAHSKLLALHKGVMVVAAGVVHPLEVEQCLWRVHGIS